MYEDEEDTLQADAEPVEKEIINEACTLPSAVTTGNAPRFIQNTDAPLHDESVIAVRDKFLNVSDEKVSDEDGCFPQHDDQSVRPDRGRLARLPVRDTSCAFGAREQGFHQRGIAEVHSARTDFCYLSDAPPDNAEECHTDQRCAPRPGARRQRCLRFLSVTTPT